MRFEPTTLWTQSTKLTSEPPCPTMVIWVSPSCWHFAGKQTAVGRNLHFYYKHPRVFTMSTRALIYKFYQVHHKHVALPVPFFMYFMCNHNCTTISLRKCLIWPI